VGSISLNISVTESRAVDQLFGVAAELLAQSGYVYVYSASAHRHFTRPYRVYDLVVAEKAVAVVDKECQQIEFVVGEVNQLVADVHGHVVDVVQLFRRVVVADVVVLLRARKHLGRGDGRYFGDFPADEEIEWSRNRTRVRWQTEDTTMKELGIYFIESMICGGVLFAVYAALLDRRTPFRWCRAFLLASVVAAAVIPLLRIPVWPGPTLTMVPFVAADFTAEPAAVIETVPVTDVWAVVFQSIYGVGVAVVLIPVLRQLLMIRRIRRRAQISRTPDYTLVRTPKRIDA